MGLNPCCSGRCSRSQTNASLPTALEVLILVVVEDALGENKMNFMNFKVVYKS